MFPGISSRTPLTVAFVVMAIGALSFALVATNASVSTFAACLVLLVAVGLLTLKSATAAQPTASVGQLIYETENPQPSLRGRNAKTVVYRW